MNISLRGIDPAILATLKAQAASQKTSVNALILSLIEQGLGLSKKRHRIVYHDLDHLAGKWSAKEAKNFAEATKPFREIDEDLWK